jgi:hypothetical protein
LNRRVDFRFEPAANLPYPTTTGWGFGRVVALGIPKSIGPLIA